MTRVRVAAVQASYVLMDRQATLDKVAAGGVAGGSDDGKPVLNATIMSVQIG